LDTVVAPATVNQFAGTPVNVPAGPVRVIVAVYAVPAANVAGVVFHTSEPVYPVPAVTVVAAVAPVTGTVTPAIAAGMLVAAFAERAPTPANRLSTMARATNIDRNFFIE
jgi:hypothetical protein